MPYIDNGSSRILVEYAPAPDPTAGMNGEHINGLIGKVGLKIVALAAPSDPTTF